MTKNSNCTVFAKAEKCTAQPTAAKMELVCLVISSCCFSCVFARKTRNFGKAIVNDITITHSGQSNKVTTIN